MELIDQRTKKIMEECKERSRKAGLSFDNESLEYIVTNRDLTDLSPKVMIPTLYDYWVNDVEVLKGRGVYKLYPGNPYETVINSRPAISYYNDNNPDWLNIMIFYHVLGHIDFFQNNIFFEHTWRDDFVGQALADKRLLATYRSTHGRFVDYAIEFSRNIDNLVGYFDALPRDHFRDKMKVSPRVDYYFDIFLQNICKVPEHVLFNEIERYNNLIGDQGVVGESAFFADVKNKYPEFQSSFDKYSGESHVFHEPDVMEFIRDHAPFLMKTENNWIKSVMTIVRNTALYFSPQIRTKIINEGWASYWHDSLFCVDERISGHEINYAVINAGVTSISRVGLNPYAIGLRLIQYVEELAEKGRLGWRYQKLLGSEERTDYNEKTGKGRKAIFELRRNFTDFMLINTFVDQEFVDKHDLFVVGKRINKERGTVEYYVKSRSAADYKKMLIDSLYHPPKVTVNYEKTNDSNIYLVHHFEGKQLYKDFVPDTLLGVSKLWGGEAQLETTEIVKKNVPEGQPAAFEYRRVLYSFKDNKVSKINL